jgi:Tfp pilus assembly protein PilF
VNAFDPDLAAPVSRLLELGNSGLALEYLEKAVVPRARGLARATAGAGAAELGQRYLVQGNSRDALRALRCAVLLTPEDVEVRTRLALLSESQGLEAEAAAQFRELLRQKPDSLPAANSLAWILATSADPVLRRPEEALQYATAVCESTGYAMAEPMDTLAAAFAALGRFDQALATARRALKAAQDAGERESAARIEERLRLYEQGRPYQKGGAGRR